MQHKWDYVVFKHDVTEKRFWLADPPYSYNFTFFITKSIGSQNGLKQKIQKYGLKLIAPLMANTNKSKNTTRITLKK